MEEFLLAAILGGLISFFFNKKINFLKKDLKKDITDLEKTVSLLSHQLNEPIQHEKEVEIEQANIEKSTQTKETFKDNENIENPDNHSERILLFLKDKEDGATIKELTSFLNISKREVSFLVRNLTKEQKIEDVYAKYFLRKD